MGSTPGTNGTGASNNQVCNKIEENNREEKGGIERRKLPTRAFYFTRIVFIFILMSYHIYFFHILYLLFFIFHFLFQDNVTPSGDNCRDFLTVKSKSTSNLSCNADTDTEKAREKVGRERIRSANYSPNKIKIRKYFNRNKNNYEDRDNGTDTDKSSIRGNVNENNNTPGNGSVHSSGGANGRHSKIPRKIKKTWKDIPESPSSSSFSVGMWLEYMGLRQYEKTFLLSGYDTIESVSKICFVYLLRFNV